MLTFGTFLAADVTTLLTVRTHSPSHWLGTYVCVGGRVCVCVGGGRIDGRDELRCTCTWDK